MLTFLEIIFILIGKFVAAIEIYDYALRNEKSL